MRRARLTTIARDRLAYQEYVDARDALDRNITAVYAKMQKKDGPKANKKKKKPVDASSNSANGAGMGNGANTINGLPMPSPAALGLITDDEHQLTIPEQLKQLIETRRRWVDTVGAIFEQKESESPGRVWGLPRTSVYEEIDEEVKAEMERLGPPGRAEEVRDARVIPKGRRAMNGGSKGKGKGRMTEVAMELG